MLEKLQKRDRVALVSCAAAAGLFLVVQFGVFPLLDHLPRGSGSIQDKELTLRRYQRLLRESGQERSRLAAAEQRLAHLESGLLESPTATLASAEWQRLVRGLADTQGLQLGSSEFIRTQDLGSGYSLVLGRVQLHCRLDQLVPFLLGLAGSPKLLAVTQLRIMALPNDPQNALNVELTIGAPMFTAKLQAGAPGQKP